MHLLIASASTKILRLSCNSIWTLTPNSSLKLASRPRRLHEEQNRVRSCGDTEEKYRSAIGLQPLHEIGGDIRYGLRSLYKKPVVSVVAVLSLALGIGATTAIFSLIYSALFHPFPYAGAIEL